MMNHEESRSPVGRDRQLELLQRAHEVRLPVVQARETADWIRQLQLIVEDQDVHGSELRNPCAITGCNPDLHLQGTQLPKPVVVAPILVGASIPSAGRRLWSASSLVRKAPASASGGYLARLSVPVDIRVPLRFLGASNPRPALIDRPPDEELSLTSDIRKGEMAFPASKRSQAEMFMNRCRNLIHLSGRRISSWQ